MTETLAFRLPVPPSKNEIPAGWSGIRKRRAAMVDIWAVACGQHRPSMSPPDLVIVAAYFYVGAEWDQGNLTTALYSIVFDAMALPVGTTPPSWRRGLAEWKGFIVDDSPRHLRLHGDPVQVIEPRRRRRCLQLTIRPEVSRADERAR